MVKRFAVEWKPPRAGRYVSAHLGLLCTDDKGVARQWAAEMLEVGVDRVRVKAVED